MTKTKQKHQTPVCSTRLVSLRLTPLEADMLKSVTGNGWGDGDFADWLNDKAQIAACKRAMLKLDAAIREQANI